MTNTLSMKTWLMMLLGALLAALTLSIGVASAQEKSIAPEGTTAKSSQEGVTAQAGKIVTKTYNKSNPILIPGTGTGPGIAAPYPSRLKVRNLDHARIKDVNVKINGYSHTSPNNVDVLLVGPTGKNLIIMSDAGGGVLVPVNGVNLTIDDEAPMHFPPS